jgi:hypothetical protein
MPSRSDRGERRRAFDACEKVIAALLPLTQDERRRVLRAAAILLDADPDELDEFNGRYSEPSS